MYLRETKVWRGDKLYRYAQIVESYRRKGRNPTNRVIVSLGRRTEQEIAAIRAALKIARDGETPVLPEKALPKAEVVKNLRYLDAALLLQSWRDHGIQQLLEAVLGEDQSTAVSTVDIITSLVLQRCLAPGSKLAAKRWFPKTALPELLGITANQFNNSRIHRALTALEAGESSLQKQLTEHIRKQNGAVSVLFLDATDTWFVGQGPPMALKGKDKEGLYRRRVGIVLLCDGNGLPLRWHTLDGRYHDPTALGDMAAEAAQLDWVKSVPMAVDRALGNSQWIEKLDALGLRYITCVPAPELESCGAPIPWSSLDEMQLCGDDPSAVEAKATAAGFVADSHGRHVLELGIFDKSRPKNARRISQAQFSLRILQEIESADEAMDVLAKRFGVSARSVREYRQLKPLDAKIRERIRGGEADALSLEQLLQIAAVDAPRQPKKLDALIAASKTKYRQARCSRIAAPAPLKARAALALNPRRLIDDRATDVKGLNRIKKKVKDVNRRLASPQSRRADSAVLAEVDKVIRKASLGNVCSIRMHKEDDTRRVVLDVDDNAWRKRRRSDGISLVVSHPEVEGAASDRVERYFSKDVIEKDFEAIKSVLKLRPVRHRTDPKLRAHVCICVLALLLTRLVEMRCEATGHNFTLSALVELLEPVRLNLIEHGKRYYTITRPSQEVANLLDDLGQASLADIASVTKQITPR